jgi:hypothetical protein
MAASFSSVVKLTPKWQLHSQVWSNSRRNGSFILKCGQTHIEMAASFSSVVKLTLKWQLHFQVWSNSRSGWGMHGDDQDSGQNKKP